MAKPDTIEALQDNITREYRLKCSKKWYEIGSFEWTIWNGVEDNIYMKHDQFINSNKIFEYMTQIWVFYTI